MVRWQITTRAVAESEGESLLLFLSVQPVKPATLLPPPNGLSPHRHMPVTKLPQPSSPTLLHLYGIRSLPRPHARSQVPSSCPHLPPPFSSSMLHKIYKFFKKPNIKKIRGLKYN